MSAVSDTLITLQNQEEKEKQIVHYCRMKRIG